MRFQHGIDRLMSVTPESELVVAPAGYSFTATTKPLNLALAISAAFVLSVRYSVISGVEVDVGLGRAARMRS
jgi:hypothetical protein